LVCRTDPNKILISAMCPLPAAMRGRPRQGVACGGSRLTYRVGKVAAEPKLPPAASRGGAAVPLPPELAAAAWRRQMAADNDGRRCRRTTEGSAGVGWAQENRFGGYATKNGGGGSALLGQGTAARTGGRVRRGRLAWDTTSRPLAPITARWRRAREAAWQGGSRGRRVAWLGAPTCLHSAYDTATSGVSAVHPRVHSDELDKFV
jgi:hypothetical protein